MFKSIDNFGIDFDNKVSDEYSIRKTSKDPEIIKEMISKVDRDSFEKFIKIGSGFNNIKKDVVDWYLNTWATNKYELYLLFGRNLFVEDKIEESIPDEEMYVNIKKLFNRPAPKNGEVDKNGNPAKDLSYFVIYGELAKQFCTNDFISNRCPKNEVLEKYCPEYYKPGMKLTKFFSNYFQDPDFDIEISKVLQNKKNIGYLRLSIDPIDYMTSAINKYKWTTCQSIFTGCHACGPFSLMLDESTTVCYNCDRNIYDYKINNYVVKANSKKYRCFVYFSKDNLCFAIGRVYPSCSSESLYSDIRDFCIRKISDMYNCKDNFFVETTAKKMDSNSCGGQYNYNEKTMSRYHIDKNKDYIAPGGRSVFVDPIKFVCSNKNSKKNKFVVGVKYLMCPSCGKKIDRLYGDSKLYCGDE